MIILCDLNYTLVENSLELRGAAQAVRERKERYREWLIELMRPHKVLLVTIRPERDRDWTLRSIKKKTGWEPHGDYFASWSTTPPDWKRHAVTELIFPTYGDDPNEYLAFESNMKTIEVYKSLGIRSMKVYAEHRDRTLQPGLFGPSPP